MSEQDRFADVDDWNVRKLLDAASENPQSSRKLVIPRYQRGLVWNEDKQYALIESVKAGYPFGALLIYEDPIASANNQREHGKKLLQLIDGLQRTHALQEYSKNPNRFFKRELVSDEVVVEISKHIGGTGGHDSERIRQMVVEWVHSILGFEETDGWETIGLTEQIVTKLLDIAPADEEFTNTVGRLSLDSSLRSVLQRFLRSVREEADIGSAEIPVITYSGDESNLPTIFELLNSQGTALSKYEIYAAQWYKCHVSIENQAIVEAIWEKYIALEGEGLTLQEMVDTDGDANTNEPIYTLFEYLFGLGQYLGKEFPYLFKAGDAKSPNSAGFNLFSACVGLHVRRTGSLRDHIDVSSLAHMENIILEATNFVDTVLSPIVSVSEQGKHFTPIYHTELQIICMIATAVRVRYDIANWAEKPDWKQKRDLLRSNLIMHYLYDILRAHWRGTADTRLYNDVEDLRLLSEVPNIDAWSHALDVWYDERQKRLLNVGRQVKPDSSQMLLLKYIYVRKFTAWQNAEKYHIEHIVPVAQIARAKNAREKWPINTIGNLALLRSSENISKGDRTYVEWLEQERERRSWDEERFQREVAKYDDILICKSNILPSEVTRERLEDFFHKRFKIVKQEFLQAWDDHISQ